MSALPECKPLTGLRVLVVEDNQDCATSTAILLALWGHKAVVAGNGKAAIEAASRQPPDVVLLDLGLPDMSGCEVASRLRALEPESRPYLVAVTGHGQVADRVESQQAGIDLHLLKPVDPVRLGKLLDELRELHRTR